MWGCGEELVAALSAVTGVLEDLPVTVCRLGSGDLDQVLGAVDRLAAVAAAARFTVTSEADQRGDIRCSASGTVRQWVTDRCPSLEVRDAGVLAKAVTRLNTPALEPVRVAVAGGRLSVPAGIVVAAELADLMPLLQPGTDGSVLNGLVEVGARFGGDGVRGLRDLMLATYGHGQVIQDQQDRRSGLTNLSCGSDIGGGITEYRMRLTPESRAVVEAAINTLSAPHPVGMLDGPAGTIRTIAPQAPGDTRTVEQRRGDALVDVCRRAVALGLAATATAGPGVASVQTAAAGGPADPGDPGDPGAAVMSPGSLSVTPLGVKATVLVTIGYDDLVTRLRPGTLLGGMTAGTALGAETIKTLACDAGIIPVLLGSNGQVLQLGSTTRAFTQSQTKALWLRDRHCTYPGCRTPATWCDAHHIRHWADGGPTDLSNGTLLCNRHHHVVHRDRITAQITLDGVEWNNTPGSYDRAHDAQAREPPEDPARALDHPPDDPPPPAA